MTADTVTGRYAAALADMTNPDTNRDGHHPGSRYVTLDAVLDHIRPVLARHGLGVAQTATQDGIRTVLICVDGATWDLGVYPVQWAGNPQQNGSAVTYARRGALQMAFGIFGETDDDGAAASKPKRAKPAPAGPSAAQIKRLQTQWSGIDRGERLHAWAQIIGRGVDSANDLTKTEATRLIDHGGPT